MLVSGCAGHPELASGLDSEHGQALRWPVCGVGERAEMSCRNLTIWQEARSVVVDVHKMTLTKLPNFELYEEGSQIHRSIKSVKSNIVEGYGRRRYKQE